MKSDTLVEGRKFEENAVNYEQNVKLSGIS